VASPGIGTAAFFDFSDPYSRQLGPDFGFNNSVICDPTTFHWNEGGWQTPDIGELIVYELSVHGFTDIDPNIPDDLAVALTRQF
jgi:1,4-alpha-glucan branching enzyme